MTRTAETSPDARPLVSDEAVEAVARHMAKDHARSHGYSLEAALDHVETRWKRYAPEARELLTAALPHMGGAVAIKPLEWRPHISRSGWVVADVPPGGYFAWELAGLGYWSHGSIVGREVPGGIEAAKAAAQADYERRIRSALVASPAPAVTEAVAWRRRGKFKWFYRDSPPPDDDASWQPLAASPADDRPREVEKALEPFQARVHKWMMACFNDEIAFSRTERNHRFLEEALELVQAMGCTANEAYQLVEYVFGRPEGEPTQEVGGVLVCLAALCTAAEIDMDAAGETELARIWTKVEKIRAKHAAKPQFSPLPGPSEPALVSLRSEREG